MYYGGFENSQYPAGSGFFRPNAGKGLARETTASDRSTKHLRPCHAYVLKSYKWHHFVLFRGKSCPAYRARLGFGWSRLTKGVFISVNLKNWRILGLKKDFVFLSANANPGTLIRRILFEKGFTGFEIRRIKIQINGLVTYDVPFTECIRN